MRGIKTHYVIEALLEVEGKIYMQQLTLLVRALLATSLIPTRVDACWQNVRFRICEFILDSVEKRQRSERREVKVDDGISSFCTRSVMLLKIVREKLKSRQLP